MNEGSNEGLKGSGSLKGGHYISHRGGVCEMLDVIVVCSILIACLKKVAQRKRLFSPSCLRPSPEKTEGKQSRSPLTEPENKKEYKQIKRVRVAGKGKGRNRGPGLNVKKAASQHFDPKKIEKKG